MDPITLAIIGALAKLSESVINDGYQALKTAIAHKCGVDSDVVKAIENVEKKPDSAGRQETLKEEVLAAHADQDPDLIKLAETLDTRLKELPGIQTVITQSVTGSSNIFSGSGDVTVTQKS